MIQHIWIEKHLREKTLSKFFLLKKHFIVSLKNLFLQISFFYRIISRDSERSLDKGSGMAANLNKGKRGRDLGVFDLFPLLSPFALTTFLLHLRRLPRWTFRFFPLRGKYNTNGNALSPKTEHEPRRFVVELPWTRRFLSNKVGSLELDTQCIWVIIVMEAF